MNSFLTGQLEVGRYIHGRPYWYDVSGLISLGVTVGRVLMSAGLSSPRIQNYSVSTFDFALILLTLVPTYAKKLPESLKIIPSTADESVKNLISLM